MYQKSILPHFLFPLLSHPKPLPLWSVTDRRTEKILHPLLPKFFFFPLSARGPTCAQLYWALSKTSIVSWLVLFYKSIKLIATLDLSPLLNLSIMNNLNATAAIPGLVREPRDGAGGDDNMSTSTHCLHRSDSLNPSKSNNKTPPVRLDGVFTSLRRAVASQKTQFAKVIVDSSRTMLRLDRDIRTRLNTLSKFSSSYFDKDDLDNNGNPREKTFIPISLRTKLVLNSSALVQNDDRLNDKFTAITTA